MAYVYRVNGTDETGKARVRNFLSVGNSEQFANKCGWSGVYVDVAPETIEDKALRAVMHYMRMRKWVVDWCDANADSTKARFVCFDDEEQCVFVDAYVKTDMSDGFGCETVTMSDREKWAAEYLRDYEEEKVDFGFRFDSIVAGVLDGERVVIRHHANVAHGGL